MIIKSISKIRMILTLLKAVMTELNYLCVGTYWYNSAAVISKPYARLVAIAGQSKTTVVQKKTYLERTNPARSRNNRLSFRLCY